jgi:hypothetical protein
LEVLILLLAGVTKPSVAQYKISRGLTVKFISVYIVEFHRFMPPYIVHPA